MSMSPYRSIVFYYIILLVVVPSPILRDLTLGLDILKEIPLITAVHEDVDMLLELNNVKDTDNVGMLDPGHNVEFPREELGHKVL
jgi:hypothetical protein